MTNQRDEIRTIGELARKARLTVRTLRHYDEIGLLKPHGRTRSGYRLYSDHDVDQLNLIVELRELGLPLKQIQRALQGGLAEVTDCVRELLPAVEQQLLSDQLRRDRLTELLQTLDGDGGSSTAKPSSRAVNIQQPSMTEAGRILKLGAVYSLTGVAQIHGLSARNAICLAQEEINSAGGVAGAMISVDIEDDASDRAQAALHTRRFIQQGQVVCLLGPGVSHLAVAAHSVANTMQTPMIASSNPGLDILGPSCPYPCEFIFRTSMGEDVILQTGLDVYSRRSQPKTGVLIWTSDDKLSSDGAQIIGGNANDYGIDLLDSIEFSKAEEDLSTYAQRAIKHNPDVIFVTSIGERPAHVMTAVRKLGFQGGFFGGYSFNPAAVVAAASAAGRGAQSITNWHVDNKVETNAEFVRNYRRKFGLYPDYQGAQAYAAMLAIADASQRANLTFVDAVGDRLRLHRALASTNIETPLGRLRFTREHDVSFDTYLVEMTGKGDQKMIAKTTR